MSFMKKLETFKYFDTLHRENYLYSIPAFINEWQTRMAACKSIGLEFSDLYLGLKLLSDCRLSRDFEESLLASVSEKEVEGSSLLLQIITRLDSVKLELDDITNILDTCEQNCVTDEINMKDKSMKEETCDVESEGSELKNCKSDNRTDDCENNNLSKNGKFSSGICHEEFETKVEFEIHRQEVEQGLAPDNRNIISTSKVILAKQAKNPVQLKCENCRRKFVTKVEFDKHSSDENRLSREKCKVKCTNEDKLSNHLGHTARSVMQTDHSCHLCNRKFKNFKRFEAHKKSHNKIFSCTEEGCSSVYTTKASLTKHHYTHTRPYSCELCGKFYGSLSVYRKHKMRHEGKLPFPCEQCDKRFIGKTELKRHMTLHTGEKPFKCSFCPQAFTQRHMCTRHEDKHRTENARI